MTYCNIENLSLPRLNNRKPDINFKGGNISSDGGLLLIRLLDKKLKITDSISKIFVEKFIESFKTSPKELILDFDVTDDEIHGHQEGRFFQGYYDHYCFLPLYVFCEVWPDVKIIFRGDADSADIN